jgi:hypothetical protein
VLRRWIEAYGVPLALYTDWKNVYVRAPNAEEQATGAVPLTQFGRMCASLGIQIIAASSPQAKARRAESRHASGQPREETAAVGDRGRAGGECIPRDQRSCMIFRSASQILRRRDAFPDGMQASDTSSRSD